MTEAVRVGIGLRTREQQKKDVEFWKKLGRYITGQAPGTVPYAIREAAGLPGRLYTGEQEAVTPEEALEFALLVGGPPRGGGVAGVGPRKFKKVPRLKSTEEALAFGKRATPEQVSRLRELRAESLEKHKILHGTKDFQAAIDEATRGQFFREALEEAGRVKAPLRSRPIEKESAAPTRPTGDRWVGDRGAMPGEPIAWLKSERAAIIERIDETGGVLYEAIKRGGQSLGLFQTVDKAARAAELRFPKKK